MKIFRRENEMKRTIENKLAAKMSQTISEDRVLFTSRS
jgi:hypothetical protein